MTDCVTMSRIEDRGRYGFCSSSGARLLFSPGIGAPLCGWDWLTGHIHPEVEISFWIDMGGSRFSGTHKHYKPGLVAELVKASRGAR